MTHGLSNPFWKVQFDVEFDNRTRSTWTNQNNTENFSKRHKIKEPNIPGPSGAKPAGGGGWPSMGGEDTQSEVVLGCPSSISAAQTKQRRFFFILFRIFRQQNNKNETKTKQREKEERCEAMGKNEDSN